MEFLATTTVRSENEMMDAEQINSFANSFVAKMSTLDDFGEFVHGNSDDIAPLINDALPTSDNCFKNEYLFDPLQSFFSNPGKCARPLTCLLTNMAFGGNVKNAVLPAVALEVFQDAALIHDDIADGATTRRGKKCLHLTDGLGIALNAGDFALSYVDELIFQDKTLNDALKLRILRELTNMKLLTITGQAIDIGWARDHKFDLTIEDYEKMATLKTAHYTCATPIVLGAMIADADDETLMLLRIFGQKCGLAFQIQDDILNVDKSENDCSKDFALDIISGKRTLIAIHAIHNLLGKHRKRLIEILDEEDNTTEEVEEALFLINSTDSIDYAKARCRELTDEANDIILSCKQKNVAYEILKSIPDWCKNRKN